jgi:hypothetical protein
MVSDRLLLAVDGSINVALGLALLAFSRPLVAFLGVPWNDSAFYPTILGGVLLGIGIALFLEVFRPSGPCHGLGLGGAIAINLSGGCILTFWLLVGELDIPLHGEIFLWTLAILLLLISIAEWVQKAGTKSSAREV